MYLELSCSLMTEDFVLDNYSYRDTQSQINDHDENS